MCKALEVSRSGFYQWQAADISQQERQKRKVIERLTFHFYDHKQRYGSPKLTYLLGQEGFTVTERTVSTYMKELGLRSCVANKFRGADDQFGS